MSGLKPILPFGRDGHWGFWSGVVGIDEDLTIYDHSWSVANASEIPAKDRTVIAKHMIALWERFDKTSAAKENK